jgi:hypothetical protein
MTQLFKLCRITEVLNMNVAAQRRLHQTKIMFVAADLTCLRKDWSAAGAERCHDYIKQRLHESEIGEE